MKKVSVTTTPNTHKRGGGGGYNLSLNAPSQSTLDSYSQHPFIVIAQLAPASRGDPQIHASGF